MITRNSQRLAPRLALVFAIGSSACDSGFKQIGGLDGWTETDDGDPDDGNGDALECIEQDVDVEAGPLLPETLDDLLLTCAANVEPATQGWRVTLTHCTDEQGQPQIDREFQLTGTDWPQPELADGDQPLHEVRYLSSTLDADGYGGRALILRTLEHERISLLAFEGTEFLVPPNHLAPLWLSLDEAACTPGPLPCTAETLFQEFPIGFALGYGQTIGTVGHDMMLGNFGIAEGTNTAYDVLVGFAVTHECYEDGDFRELQLGIVAKTVDP